MKIKTAALLTAVLLGLSGCGAYEDSGGSIQEIPPEQAASVIAGGFDLKADITMGDLKASGDFNRTADGVCSVTLTAPENLDGLSFLFDQETVTISYLGLTLSLDGDSMLPAAMGKAMAAAVNKAAEPEGIRVTAEGDTLTVAGSADSGDFTLTMDRKSSSMLALCIPSLELECSFSSPQGS